MIGQRCRLQGDWWSPTWVGLTLILMFHWLPVSGYADWSLTELAGQVGKMLEYPNQSQQTQVSDHQSHPVLLPQFLFCPSQHLTRTRLFSGLGRSVSFTWKSTVAVVVVVLGGPNLFLGSFMPHFRATRKKNKKKRLLAMMQGVLRNTAINNKITKVS